jgi:hypothetical protein
LSTIIARAVRTAGVPLLALILLSTAHDSLGVPAGSMPSNCDYQLAQCFQYGLKSPHFVVFYNTTGTIAVTSAWAGNVSMMAESAYNKLVTGEGFTPPARNPIPIYLDLAKGGFTNFRTCEACPSTPEQLQNLQIEYRYKSPCPSGCGIPTSNWELAHEVFGTIEFSMFGGALPYGSWLSESSANWGGYTVTGNESRWDPWVISAWLGPEGTTETPFIHRTFDNTFFLVFLSEHYGGAEVVKRIMLGANLTNANEDFASQLRALGYKETLAQVTDDFAAAILTGNFTDRDGASAVLAQPPPIAATATWAGANQSISAFTAGVNGFRPGDPLEVHVPYGIEYVRVKPASNSTVSVGLRAQNASCFAAKVVESRGGNFYTSQIPPSAQLIVTSPGRYDDIFVAVTRGVCSNGEFSVFLGAASPQGGELGASGAFYLYAALAAIVMAVAFVAVILSRRRSGRRLKPEAHRAPADNDKYGTR